MKRIILIFISVTICSVISSAVFAQEADDLDGDGIKNSEDACPNIKGTKANKGCPEKSESSALSGPAIKTLADLNCEFILSGACNEILMEASEREIKTYYGSRYREAYLFYGNRSEVPVFSFYSLGFVFEITFFPGSGNISEDIQWGDKKEVVTRKYGSPKGLVKGKNVDGEKYEILKYEGMEFQFTKGKLDKLTLKNMLSESEAAAVHAKHMAERAESEIAANSPEAKAAASAEKEKKIQPDYKTLLDQLDAKLLEGDRIVKSEIKAIAAGGLFKKAVQDKLDKIREAGDGLIAHFGKTYEGMIPEWMIKAIADKWRPETFTK